jgi:hypothetical protein
MQVLTHPRMDPRLALNAMQAEQWTRLVLPSAWNAQLASFLRLGKHFAANVHLVQYQLHKVHQTVQVASLAGFPVTLVPLHVRNAQ